ncbi:hypothetical protein [Cupriavidus sp. CuC1]|uniref:hypothetical protein n=1 Tax=Cupriavidus sp. CuC1 TaxID=3373131 RepID=UPI0037D02DA8
MTSPEYPLCAESLRAMLRVARITNESMQRALHDHLVLGDSQKVAAERYGYQKQQISVQVKRIKEKIKPAFDAYSTSARRIANGAAER